MTALEHLLGPAARIEHFTRRVGLFSKRIVRVDGERYVLHRFLRARAAARLLWLLGEGARHDVPLQRPVAWTRSSWQALRLGGFWVATGFLPGEPILGIGSPANLAALGGAIARLHCIEGERPGALFRAQAPWPGWLRRLQAQLARGLSVGAGAEERSAQHAHAQWLSANGVFLAGLESYQLTHGDLYGANVLAAGDDVSLIDYERAGFEPAGLELATALLRDFCGGRVALRMKLLEGYLADCSPRVSALWQAHAAFYLVAAALRLADRRDFRARQLARLGRSGASARGEALRYAAWARRLMDAQRAGATSTVTLLRQIE